MDERESKIYFKDCSHHSKSFVFLSSVSRINYLTNEIETDGSIVQKPGQVLTRLVLEHHHEKCKWFRVDLLRFVVDLYLISTTKFWH